MNKLPSENHYVFEEGRPWSYALLTAPFDIPIHLDSLSAAKIRDSINTYFEPVFTRDITAEKTIVSDYTTRLNSTTGLDITPAQRNQIIREIRNIYDNGIVDRETYAKIEAGELPSVRFIHDNASRQFCAPTRKWPTNAAKALSASTTIRWPVRFSIC